MTLDQFLAVQGITYRRAREWQVHFDGLAEAIKAEGFDAQATHLHAIGARVWAMADRYIDSVFERVG